MSKAAQGFLSEAYFWYVEGRKPRRTPLIGKRSIYKRKLADDCQHIAFGHRVTAAEIDSLNGAAGRGRQGIFHFHGL